MAKKPEKAKTKEIQMLYHVPTGGLFPMPEDAVNTNETKVVTVEVELKNNKIVRHITGPLAAPEVDDQLLKAKQQARDANKALKDAEARAVSAEQSLERANTRIATLEAEVTKLSKPVARGKKAANKPDTDTDVVLDGI